MLLCFGLLGCATFPMSREPVQKSNLTVGTIKKEIVKGQTTQAEILKLFGSPNLITKNRTEEITRFGIITRCLTKQREEPMGLH